MNRRKIILALLAFAGVLTAPPAGAAGQKLEMASGAQATIEVFQFLENTPPAGWAPVMMRIHNGARVERTWTTAFDTRLGGAQTCALGEWMLPVPAGETRDFPIFVPRPWLNSPGAFHNTSGWVTGPGVVQGRIGVAGNYLAPNRTAFTAMSMRLSTENWSRLENELLPTPAGAGGSSRWHGTLAGSRFDPALIPPDWRSFSGFETVWLHRDDWIEMSAAHRLAVLRWAAQGGRLYVVGVGPGLEDLPPLPDKQTVEEVPFQAGRYGIGLITRLPAEDKDGNLITQPATGGATADPRLPIAAMASEIRAPRTGTAAIGALSTDISATELETATGEIRPGGILLGLFVAAIAVLLGPVNIFVLAPARRRARLFVTVPLIALGGAIALVGLILVQDGTGGQGRRGALVVLLPDRPEALVLQEQCIKTGLVIGRSFEFPEDALLADYTQGVSTRTSYAYNQRPLRADLDRRGGQLGGAWFTSRTVLSHHARQFVATRAALTLETDAAGTHSVISTCPGALRDLVLVDNNRNHWWAAEVPPGHKVTLVPLQDPATHDTWRAGLRQFGVSLAAAADTVDQPLTFRAAADSWDEHVPLPTLASIDWRDDALFVLGPVRVARE